jgi:hypothetical protein
VKDSSSALFAAAAAAPVAALLRLLLSLLLWDYYYFFGYFASEPRILVRVTRFGKLNSLMLFVQLFLLPPPSPGLLVPNFQRLFFLFFFLSFVCLFLFRGGVREAVGEEEEEEEEKGRRRYGNENVVVFKMSFSSHGFPRGVAGIVSLGRKQKKAFVSTPPEKVSNVY